jgi:hypothetical protein
MKKTVMLILFLICAFVFADTLASQARISEMTGTVELKKAGTENWLPAKTGDNIEKSTVISTGFKSTAILSVGNSTIIVRPLTRLSVEELVNQNDTETINIGLNAGRVRVEVKPPAGGKASFSSQSPSATASVRGTVFEMDTVSLRVIEGAVSYAPSRGALKRSVTVSAGRESRLDTDTGMALLPMDASREARTLPALAGQESREDSGGARISVQAGESITVGIIFGNGE